MADICYPPGTDWSCRWTEEELEAQREDEVMGPKIEVAEAFAWSLLAALTLYRIGTCPVTVRPCAARCAPAGSYRSAVVRGSGASALPVGTIGMLNPYISGGRWLNACGCGPRDCGCEALSQVILPGPVGSIISVRLDGEEVPRSAYRVMNGDRLVRLDGEDWPACQDMAASDEDGFSVTYYRGAAPNILTRAAAGVLANEFLLACDGDDACRLPYNVTNVSRQGETYEFDNGVEESAASIPQVAAVLRIFNPNGLKSPVIVASPDAYLTPVPTWR